MTTEEYFNTFLTDHNLTDEEREQISDKHLSLRERLRELLKVEDDFLTGSYPRNTMIKPNGDDKFDVDFFLAFNNDKFGEYELPKLLELVKTALLQIKGEDEDIESINDQNRSIGVEYSGNFQIDVVPAIEIEKNKLYKIFDKKSMQPLDSNPKLHGKQLSETNENTESGSTRRLVPIIKLLKSWKRNKCDYVKSFHLELLAVEILKEEPIESISSGLCKFFSNAEEYLQEACLVDPANSQNLIDEYLDEDGVRGELIELISKEKNFANDALNLEESGDIDNAIQKWKKIFENFESNKTSNNIPRYRKPTIISNPPKQHCEILPKFN